MKDVFDLFFISENLILRKVTSTVWMSLFSYNIKRLQLKCSEISAISRNENICFSKEVKWPSEYTPFEWLSDPNLPYSKFWDVISADYAKHTSKEMVFCKCGFCCLNLLWTGKLMEINKLMSKQTFTCSKSTIEIL